MSREILLAMNGRMHHRGPDDEGILCRDGIGIAMRRLSIIDVGGGHQPIANEDESIWIVLNGEIYNYVELRAALTTRGHRLRTAGDVETVAHLFEEGGIDALSELNGMFALAIFDSPRKTVWLARDRLGIKPLYVARTSRFVAFASDVTALRAAVPSPFREQAFWEYLSLGYVSEPDTAFTGIEKLGPGCWMRIGREGIQRGSFWSPPRPSPGAKPAQLSVAREELVALVADAVKLQMRSDVPVAALASGGVDSSAVVTFAAQLTEKPIQTLTVEFEQKGGEDAEVARLVSRAVGSEHIAVRFGPAEAARALDAVLPFVDEPLSDTALLPTYHLAQEARDRGIKVLLSGAGGDELFGGYARHLPARTLSPAWVARSLPETLRRPVAALWALLQPEQGFRARDPLVAWGAAIAGCSPRSVATSLDLPEAPKLLRDAIHREFEDVRGLLEDYGPIYGRMQTDLRHYLVANILALTDKATMAASIEARVPLLDHRLVEFAYRIPPETNLLGGRPKGLFRDILATRLPPRVLSRGKEGFSAPMSAWMISSDAFHIRDTLLSTSAPIIGQRVTRRALERAIREAPRRPERATTIYAMYMFARWWESVGGRA